MRYYSLAIFAFIGINFTETKIKLKQESPLVVIIGKGHMPNVTNDNSGNIHVVYGTGDSIMYTTSKDGKSFTSPSVVAVLPKLFASAMRGPQIAAAANSIVVTACTKTGNIFSYHKPTSGKWTKAVKVNDGNETAKEALIALSANGLNSYAVWLSVKDPKGQNVYGAKSTDGGKTWMKNVIVYDSPDSTVCECCKPSVAMKGNNVYVMFRNWLSGNRDLYLIKSTDGGKTFAKAEKLGLGSWKLNGCPMDGGGLAISKSGYPRTVWRREGKIYADTPDMPEKEIGEGRSCSIETINDKNIYTWTESGNVIVMKPNGMKMNLGKGSLPLAKALTNEQVICVWENKNEIHSTILSL